MSGTTTLGFPYPELTDDPNGAAQIQALAESVDSYIAAAPPTGDPTNSKVLTGADLRVTQGTRTTILTSTFTLARAQMVLVGGQARFQADPASGGSGLVCLLIDVDSSVIAATGSIHMSQYGVDPAQYIHLSIPTRGVSLAAGSHTIRLRADRDANNTINATADMTFDGNAYNPTTLTVIV